MTIRFGSVSAIKLNGWKRVLTVCLLDLSCIGHVTLARLQFDVEITLNIDRNEFGKSRRLPALEHMPYGFRQHRVGLLGEMHGAPVGHRLVLRALDPVFDI